MNDELHAAALVEEALENDRRMRRQGAECRLGGGEIFRKLRSRGISDAGLRKIVECAIADILADSRNRLRQLIRTPGRLAEPERNRRRLAFGVLDAHAP